RRVKVAGPPEHGVWLGLGRLDVQARLSGVETDGAGDGREVDWQRGWVVPAGRVVVPRGVVEVLEERWLAARARNDPVQVWVPVGQRVELHRQVGAPVEGKQLRGRSSLAVHTVVALGHRVEE